MSADETRQPGETELTPAERRALAALHAASAVAASAASRARARAAFVHGATEPPVARGRTWRVAGWSIAAAAVLLVALFAYGSRPAASWRLARVHDPDGELHGVAGRTVGAELPPGFIETPEHGEFDLTLGKGLQLRMLSGTGLTLPEPPRRWLAPEVRVELQRGEVYGSTGGERLAAAFEFTTPEASARITGTTFAVLLTADGTCVCVLDGHVEVVRHAGGTPTQLPEASKCIIYADGRPTQILPIDDMERAKLTMVRAAASGQ